MDRHFASPRELWDWLEAVGSGRIEGSRKERVAVEAVLDDPAVADAVRYVELLEEELARLEASPGALAHSGLAGMLLQDLNVALAFAVETVAERAMAVWEARP